MSFTEVSSVGHTYGILQCAEIGTWCCRGAGDETDCCGNATAMVTITDGELNPLATYVTSTISASGSGSSTSAVASRTGTGVTASGSTSTSTSSATTLRCGKDKSGTV